MFKINMQWATIHIYNHTRMQWHTRWFKYDRDWLRLVYTQISPGHIWITLYYMTDYYYMVNWWWALFKWYLTWRGYTISMTGCRATWKRSPVAYFKALFQYLPGIWEKPWFQNLKNTDRKYPFKNPPWAADQSFPGKSKVVLVLT
jgi:hypothetical protein